jgi:Tfp pilus assembly protein PilF
MPLSVTFAFGEAMKVFSTSPSPRYEFQLALGLCLALYANGCCSRPVRTRTQAPPPTELLKIAKADFQRGKLTEAEKELRDFLERDSRNNEAHYYLNLIAETRTKAKQNEEELKRDLVELWYPTLPPKRVH